MMYKFNIKFNNNNKRLNIDEDLNYEIHSFLHIEINFSV